MTSPNEDLSNQHDEEPLVTVGIVNYNSGKFLSECLEQVLKSTYNNFEIIIVDNASRDESLAYLNSIRQDLIGRPLKVIRNTKNLGPAVACNQIVDEARGEFIAILASDTVPHSNWIRQAIDLFLGDEKIAIVQCKLLHYETGLLDAVGDYLSPFGFLVHIVEPSKEPDVGQFDNIRYIFGIKSAACFIRRKAVKDLGGFDQDFFIFYEETDLCWRAWLHKWRVCLAPHSVVLHHMGASVRSSPLKSYLIYFHGTKNQLMTLIKNCTARNLLTVLPLDLAIWLFVAAKLRFKGRLQDSVYVLRALYWVLCNMKLLVRKRKSVRRGCTEIPSFLVKKIGLSSFLTRLREY